MSERNGRATTMTAPTQDIGLPGIIEYGGRIYTEWDRRLQGMKGAETYRQMGEQDAVVGSMFLGLVALIAGAGYRLPPADESPEAEEIAAFVETAFRDMAGSWRDTVEDILTCAIYGYSLLETTYKRRTGEQPDDEIAGSRHTDGKWGWKRWALRPQETIESWTWKPDWTVETAVQRAAPKYALTSLPVRRCLHFQIRPRRQSPGGLSLLRHLHEAWYFKRELAKTEAITAVKSGVGTMVMYAPEHQMATEAQRSALEKKISNFHVNEQQGLLLSGERDPETKERLWHVELIASPGTQVIDLDKAIGRYNRDLYRGWYMGFMTLGDTGRGSYAQSISLVDAFLSFLTSITLGIEEVINVQAIRRLLRVNGLSTDLAPTFAFQPVKRRDVKAFAEAFKLLADAGVIDPTAPDVRRYVNEEVMDLPMPEEMDEDQEARGERPERETETPEKTEVEPASPLAIRQATERQFADDDLVVTIGEEEIADALAWFDEHVDPKYRGMLGARPG